MNKLFATIISILFFSKAAVPVFAAWPAVADASAIPSFRNLAMDKRVTKLTAYLASHDSPLTAQAGHFIFEADKNDLDWKLVAAISGVESTFGKHTPAGSFNGWGWGIPTGAQWGVAFKNWKDGITAVSEGLRKNYVNKGATTIEQIGRIYAASPAWSWKVHFFLDQIEAFAPASSRTLSVEL
ncbi:hypothetical protein HY086_02490 [Candidatus Gottesmanbacteria bacterium]|nr:hypothetical protein [Candidatus Gottesmanbacteria bacterium]